MMIGQSEDVAEDKPDVTLFEKTYRDHADARRFWGSILWSMFTLFQLFTLYDWSGVVQAVIETQQPAGSSSLSAFCS